MHAKNAFKNKIKNKNYASIKPNRQQNKFLAAHLN